ncbi:sugar phosphate isomerase [Paenibacillus darwinianus]|uniref:Sugar phosphate isomerase n=1 Tax=Paenibacillus darwinianus TaxID=1380763 RepID=A0A9W5RYR3_9BACL|nr:sugar phosphate isomerase/epimerase [Paenibacillus darwinianus]EXX85021.1 sugar phosphate isomerase [Paenibacillus darwinianus]EXX86275.1 sugar phosphate isomerase [Paenibacillus darwinianus]EXX86631.1 sugar phosphate isomerase [Paenibacillus darwinianus]
MKLGISTYSLYQALKSEEMDILAVMEWIAASGGEHVEIVPLGFDIEKPGMVEAIRRKAEETGLDISNYAVGGNLLTSTEEEYQHELKKLREQVDIAHRLGVDRMRHDIAWRPIAECTAASFEADLPRLAEGCAIIAEYAERYGITTSVENHGYYVQAAERVQRLIHSVNRKNFRTAIDVGNFMCADEDSVASLKKNLPFASMVHLKDFYLRPSYRNPGKGWFSTVSGNFIRGAIVGHGDIDMWEVIRVMKESGYDGYISIEFEGMEDCRQGTLIGLENARTIWEQV